jgi:hypothetical protein
MYVVYGFLGVLLVLGIIAKMLEARAPSPPSPPPRRKLPEEASCSVSLVSATTRGPVRRAPKCLISGPRLISASISPPGKIASCPPQEGYT